MVSLLTWLERVFIFFPTQYPAGQWEAKSDMIEDVWFKTEDGVKLHGWFLPASDTKDVILFVHGNAGNMSDRLPRMNRLHEGLQASIFMFDYRGYGRSEGQPSVEGVLKDITAAQDYLAARLQMAPSKLILMGRSLGAVVAVYGAATKGARGLILESAFSSFVDVAEAIYPWLPAKSVLRRDIQAADLIERYHGPLLQSHGTSDQIIPIELGLKVFQAAHEPKEFVKWPGCDHNDPPPLDYDQRLKSFLKSLPSP
jgi:hypothetical protein